MFGRVDSRRWVTDFAPGSWNTEPPMLLDP